MRLLLPLFVVCFFAGSSLVWSKHATAELSIAQADWNPKTKTLNFDVQLKAVDRPFYLAFSDIVIALPKAMVGMNVVAISLIPGSTQFFNLAGDRITFPGIRTRIKSTADSVLFIIQLMPNSFMAMGDFFEQSAYISLNPGESRVGRFSIVEVQQSPGVLKPFYAAKGPSTLLLAFDPKDQLKAVDLNMQSRGAKPTTDVLKLFESSVDEKEYTLEWKWMNSRQLWQLWWSTDLKDWKLYQSGKGGQGTKIARSTLDSGIVHGSISFRLTFDAAAGGSRSVVRMP